MKKTKGNYETYLNEIGLDWGHEDWIIGGKERTDYMTQNRYGTALRNMIQ